MSVQHLPLLILRGQSVKLLSDTADDRAGLGLTGVFSRRNIAGGRVAMLECVHQLLSSLSFVPG